MQSIKEVSIEVFNAIFRTKWGWFILCGVFVGIVDDGSESAFVAFLLGALVAMFIYLWPH